MKPLGFIRIRCGHKGGGPVSRVSGFLRVERECASNALPSTMRGRTEWTVWMCEPEGARSTKAGRRRKMTSPWNWGGRSPLSHASHRPRELTGLDEGKWREVKPQAHARTSQIPVRDAASALLRRGERGRCGRAVIHIGCGGVGPRRTLRTETEINWWHASKGCGRNGCEFHSLVWPNTRF